MKNANSFFKLEEKPYGYIFWKGALIKKQSGWQVKSKGNETEIILDFQELFTDTKRTSVQKLNQKIVK